MILLWMVDFLTSWLRILIKVPSFTFLFIQDSCSKIVWSIVRHLIMLLLPLELVCGNEGPFSQPLLTPKDLGFGLLLRAEQLSANN